MKDNFRAASEAKAERAKARRGRRQTVGPLPVMPQQVRKEFEAIVMGEAGGDALVVRTANSEEVMVRLYGIDVSEAALPLERLRGRQVTIQELGMDDYGYALGLVKHEDRSINVDLVAQGHALYDVRDCEAQPICGSIEAAESEAREARRGIWAE